MVSQEVKSMSWNQGFVGLEWIGVEDIFGDSVVHHLASNQMEVIESGNPLVLGMRRRRIRVVARLLLIGVLLLRMAVRSR